MKFIYACIAWFIVDAFLYHFVTGVPYCIRNGLTLGGLALIIILTFGKGE